MTMRKSKMPDEEREAAEAIREAEVWNCADCTSATRGIFDEPRACEDCGHYNASWDGRCHQCNAHLDDPAPTPGWMLDDAKADDDYERSADR